MGTGLKAWALAVVLAMAGAAQAVSISVQDMGDVDTTALGGGVQTEFQIYRFTVARTTETAQINALDITVVSSAGEIHQIWGETNFFGDNYYTDSPAAGDIIASAQVIADSYLFDSVFTLNVSAPSEDMLTVVDGNNGASSYTGPASSADPYYSSSGMQAGFGTTFQFVGAVPTGSEKESYTVYQLVIPDALAGTITVHIEAAGPDNQYVGTGSVHVAEFVFGGAVVPTPVAAGVGLAMLGGIVALRRMRKRA